MPGRLRPAKWRGRNPQDPELAEISVPEMKRLLEIAATAAAALLLCTVLGLISSAENQATAKPAAITAGDGMLVGSKPVSCRNYSSGVGYSI